MTPSLAVLVSLLLLIPTPALAFQTEADPQELEDKRTAAIEREERRDRIAKRAEEGQPSPAPSQPATASALPTSSAPSSGVDWWAIAECESGGDWDYNGPSGYDGGLQFHPDTWISAGGGRYAPYAWMATPAEQIAVASSLSLSHWPGCGAYG